MCARCEELEEEVAYLKSELGLQRDVTATDRIARTLGVRPGVVELIHLLYRANGRLLSRWQILEQIPPKGGALDDDRVSNLVSVMICFARKALGKDAIEVAWGRGYRMSPAGMARVAAILSPALEQRAA